MSANDPPAIQTPLRIAGVITLVAGIIQFGIDISIFASLTSPKLGAWWSAVIIIVTSILAIVSTNRCVVIAACTLSVIAVIVGVIGCAVDGIANSIITDLVTCVSDTGVITGDPAWSFEAASCYSFGDTHDCLCVQAITNAACLIYDGPLAAKTCNNILTIYTNRLHAGLAFDLIATFLVFAVSIMTCVSVCCPGSVGGTTTTVIQQQGQPQPGNVQYAGQPQVYAGQPQQQYGQTYGQAPPPVVVVVASPDQNYKPQY